MIRSALFAVLALGAASALAQGGGAYPVKPIRLVVSVPPGGPQDSLARGVAHAITGATGQQVVVDNRPGANTIIAANAVSKAAPDGYTLLMATDSTLSINQHVYKRLPYDPEADFAPITHLVNTYQVVYASAAMPGTLDEVIAMAKANPGKLNYASYGAGSTPHLAAIKLLQRFGLEVEHVAFKGSADAFPALASGQVHLLYSSVGPGLGMAAAGKIRPLVVAGPERLDVLPGVPTAAELGHPELFSRFWFGLVAPAKTPKAVIDRLAQEARAYVRGPAFNELAKRFTFESVGSTPEEFAKFLRDDSRQYKALVEAAKIEPM